MTNESGFAHESHNAETVEWYTPPSIFQAIGLNFDLDPCSPGKNVVQWVPARRCFTIVDDGLTQPWDVPVLMKLDGQVCDHECHRGALDAQLSVPAPAPKNKNLSLFDALFEPVIEPERVRSNISLDLVDGACSNCSQCVPGVSKARVWMNPPYGSETAAWMQKLAAHGDGIGLVFARTDTGWFVDSCTKATLICFISQRVRFVEGKTGVASGTPGAGSMLVAYGDVCAQAVLASKLGPCMTFISAPERTI